MTMPSMATQYAQYLPQGVMPNWAGYAPEQLRTYQESALARLQQRPGVNTNVAPYMANQLRDRAIQGANTFQLGAALGQYGQPGMTDTQLQLGGVNLQQLITAAVDQALNGGARGGAQSPSSFRQYINAATSAFGGQPADTAQYGDIAEALGFSPTSDTTSGAYGGFVNRFLAPRLEQLRGPFGNMAARGLAERERNLYETNPLASQVSPTQFLNYIMQGF